MDDTLHAINYLNVMANGWYQTAAKVGALGPPSIDHAIGGQFGTEGFPF
jgi:hypothetical protein